ncbi:hypothetical protein TWF106_002381 [Orbilia oligospora]|uniref:Uncharacterized protein n=1 Tax=Orbilia oligospora TaxID=2813651 RepID=A0A7C8U497_ORBOL|nr:hypothetical protein TWF788_006213 [Orbilia oligospora]KAF3202467.1 hypothetical protein TWF106_002381 [Orbilia oligospora]
MALKRPPEVDLVALPTAPSPSLPTAAATKDDEIVELSLPKKPRMQFNREEFKINPDGVLAGANDLRNRLAAFLPSLKAADEQLEREKLAGRIADRRIEIDSDSDSGDSSSSEEESDSEDDDDDDDNMSDDDVSAPTSLPPNTMAEVLITNLLSPQQISAEGGDGANVPSSSLSPKKLKKRNKNKQPYIEMNLGLGVLEELKPSSGSDDKETNERRELIDRIYELRRLQEAREETSDGDRMDEMVITEDAKKKVVIEELE